MEFEKIREMIAQRMKMEENKITLDSNFSDDIGADSLDLLEMVMALEEEFDVEISDEDAERFKTVGDVVEFLKNL